MEDKKDNVGGLYKNNRSNKPRDGVKSVQNKPVSKTAALTGRVVAKKPSKVSIASRVFKNRHSGGSASVKVVHLGGLNEIGKNMICIECCKDMFVIDCGMGFPDTDMLGVAVVLPDYSYVENNVEKLRGVVITHGHEDHIGGMPFFLKKFNVPIYGTKLTIGLIEEKLKEHGILKNVKLNVCSAGQIIRLGCMSVEMINVNHSIPDSVGLAIYTPAGVIVHTGDFKIDYTPIDGPVIDLARFAEIGRKGVMLLMTDSTNAEKPGHTISERQVGESFQKLFVKAQNRRIIIASFSSNIHRIQQVIDNAMKYERYVAVSGRSMENIVAKAIELGYLKVPDGIIVSMDALSKLPKEKIIIITTGSQGEQMSALSRMANGMHKSVVIDGEDFIIISASPIPGNEKTVTSVINSLLKLGSDVIYESMYEVHVSGHACLEELKIIHGLTKPKYFIPVHGEQKHLVKHANLAMDMGMPRQNIFIGDIGNVIELSKSSLRQLPSIPAGKVLVDGLGVGDVGSIVLRDRKHLGQDGLIVVVVTLDSATGEVAAGPDIVSRGFVYVRESEPLMEEARRAVLDALDDCDRQGIHEWSVIKNSIKDELSKVLYDKTRRSPMILPIIMEV